MGKGTATGEAIKLCRSTGNGVNPISAFVVMRPFTTITANTLTDHFNTL
jgi:hypothetical protein